MTKGKILFSLLTMLVASMLLVLNHRAPRPEPDRPTTAADVEKTSSLAIRSSPIPILPSSTVPTNALTFSNLYSQILNGDAPKLTPEQIEVYLAQNHRDAGSLLAVFRANKDTNCLLEAEQQFPNDPRVDFAAIFASSSPEERVRWLDQLKQSDPENALPNYLSARDALQSGRTDDAIRELTAASGKQQFQEYTSDFFQNAQDAYRSAGYSEAEAKTIAGMDLLLPDLHEFRDLDRAIVNLAKTDQQAGDSASAQALFQMNEELSQRLAPSPGQPLITQLVGIAVEADVLRAMDPASPLGDSGETVQDRMNELTQTRQTLRELGSQEGSLFEKMSEQDVISFWDRWQAFGSEATLRWAIGKYGPQPSRPDR